MNDDALDAVARALTEATGRPPGRDVPLAGFSTYRLGGPAAVLAEVATLAELEAVSAAVTAHPVPVLVVGRGSNLLVSDAGFLGVAVHLTGEFEELAVPDSGEPGSTATVTAGAGVPLPVLARRSAAAGWAGLEFYVGIPGSVGGAVKMNAGGHGRETAEVLTRTWVYDLAGAGGERERTPPDLAFAYRGSVISPTEVVTRAELAADADDPAVCEERVAEVVRWRREHQPGGSNAGSVFTNPTGDAAGRLIDACGLKGRRVGGAVVSPKHANFFQAEDRATADDVYRLVLEVQQTVERQTGVHLDPELTLVGFEALDGS